MALICGQGINAVGVAPDGRVARFAAVGTLSGDWGGATSLGEAGLGAAIRARDGRGPRTALERTVPAVFGLARAEVADAGDVRGAHPGAPAGRALGGGLRDGGGGR